MPWKLLNTSFHYKSVDLQNYLNLEQSSCNIILSLYTVWSTPIRNTSNLL